MTINPNSATSPDEVERHEGGLDLDGDGKVSPWESNLCRICLMAALAIAFGDKVISGML